MKEMPKKELGAGRVAFLARLPVIKEGIDAGRTVMSIYREYGSQLGIGYSQLDRYVNTYIKGKQHGNSDRAPEKGKSIKKAATVRTRDPGQPAFVSSDTPRDKDSLIKRKE